MARLISKISNWQYDCDGNKYHEFSIEAYPLIKEFVKGKDGYIVIKKEKKIKVIKHVQY